MTEETTESCPGCGSEMVVVDGPTHRYIGASPSCWAFFTVFQTSPEAAVGRLAACLLDAYCVQHPGVETPQAVQSVAVHLLTLHAVIAHGLSPSDLVRFRVAAVEAGRSGDNRYKWLASEAGWPQTHQDADPGGRWQSTVHDIAAGNTSVDQYIEGVYRASANPWADQVESWYQSSRARGATNKP